MSARFDPSQRSASSASCSWTTSAPCRRAHAILRSGAQAGIRSTVWDPDTRIVDKGPTTLQILQAPPANSSVATAQAGQ